jgi:ABC-type nitrate/sulfonate/bicarbonate transport system permease component
MSGLKVAATLAVTGAVVGEFVGANEGLGYVILQANGNIDTAMLFAALIIMSMLGILMFAIIETVADGPGAVHRGGTQRLHPHADARTAGALHRGG